MSVSPEINQEELALFRDMVLRALEQEVAPHYEEWEQAGIVPRQLWNTLGEAGMLCVDLPEEYGAAGTSYHVVQMIIEELSRLGYGGLASGYNIHANIVAPYIYHIGNDEQKQRWLPSLIKGDDITCFGVTEPNAGLDTTSIETRAVRQPDGNYVIDGRKIWTTTAQEATKFMILARTTPKDQCKKSTDGISLFYTDFDRSKIEATVIPKMGRKAVESNAVFIDGLHVPKEDLIGEEGKGFYYILHSLNPERILIASEAIGIGQSALRRAVQYAKDREVFGRPIGMNQSIQHPLAKNWAELEAAWMIAMKAADLYDRGEPCGAEANAAKYLGAEAGFEACTQAVLTHGGMGYAKEYTVERLMREVMIPRIAPVSMQMILSHIAEKKLGLPKSY